MSLVTQPCRCDWAFIVNKPRRAGRYCAGSRELNGKFNNE